MTPAELNEILEREHPGAARMLSPLGRRLALPLGIPQQAAQAETCERKATIGQITRGDGAPLTLPSLARHFSGLDTRSTFLYAPQAGMGPLRAAWRRHLGAQGEGGVPMSVPVVTTGITHAISIGAELFSDPGTPVIVATPYWDNYDNIFTLHTGAPLLTFPFYDERGRYNVRALRDTLATVAGRAVVILNFPANPTGYTPLTEEVAEIVEVLTSREDPLTVFCDDAYQGLFFEEDVYHRSLFSSLARAADPSRTIVCKMDGATKELVFFGGRVGFLTFSAQGRAGEALAEKAAALIRATISSGSAPAQVAVLEALRSATLEAEQESVVEILRERYRALRDAFAAHELVPAPFNSGCFATLLLPAHLDADEVRHRLIREQSTGVIAVPSANGIRVAFCSIEVEDIPDLVERIARVVKA